MLFLWPAIGASVCACGIPPIAYRIDSQIKYKRTGYLWREWRAPVMPVDVETEYVTALEAESLGIFGTPYLSRRDD